MTTGRRQPSVRLVGMDIARLNQAQVPAFVCKSERGWTRHASQALKSQQARLQLAFTRRSFVCKATQSTTDSIQSTFDNIKPNVTTTMSNNCGTISLNARFSKMIVGFPISCRQELTVKLIKRGWRIARVDIHTPVPKKTRRKGHHNKHC
jgi:hypothetical protein